MPSCAWSSGMRLTFADLVAPYRPRDFLRTVWSKRPQHLPGSPGRFAALLTWSDLNGILRHHHLAPPRLRLARGGSILPADAFVDDVVMPSGEEIPRVRPVRLESELRKGGARRAGGAGNTWRFSLPARDCAGAGVELGARAGADYGRTAGAGAAVGSFHCPAPNTQSLKASVFNRRGPGVSPDTRTTPNRSTS